MAKLYPVKVDIHLYITDGEQVGDINYVMPFSRLPTEADMPGVIETASAALPPGFRLMSRHEASMHFMREERGYRGPDLALPALDAGDEWHDPEAAGGFSSGAYDEEDED